MDEDRPTSGAGDEALHRRLIELWRAHNGDVGVITLDPAGRIVGASVGAERLLGYGPGALAGQPAATIFTPEDRELAIDRHEFETAARVGRSEDDRWHLRQDGSRLWVSGTMAAIDDDDGRRIGFVKVFRDRTDLRTRIDALENRLAEASRRIDAKVAAMEMLGHELRNPVGALSAATVLLRRLELPAQAQQTLDVLERQVESMRRLLDDLRDATRLEGGAVPLAFVRVELQAALRAVIDAQTSRARGGQTIELIAPEVPIVLEADPVRLDQVFANVLDNAIKYSPDGGPIWLTATVETPFAVVRVRDRGIGISAAALPRIFDMFTRDSRAVASGADGLGVGLAVVKDLVQMHGGTVEIQQPTGGGTEITINLPLRQQRGR